MKIIIVEYLYLIKAPKECMANLQKRALSCVRNSPTRQHL
ncbi:hypothetical protein PORCAN_493 [Porphyromonas crevioricanis JCM 13913]|nr:hypothetical protein PORCAN_493 [Porphyromonas crevioricanis JCM 13913]